MKIKYLIILIIIVLISMTLVSAQDNQTIDQSSINENALSLNNNTEKISSNYDDQHIDYGNKNTAITQNVVKYYGDDSKNFKIQIIDNNGTPKEPMYILERIR